MAYPAQIKNQAKALRKKGYSLNEIANQLGIAKSTSSLWTRHIQLDAQAKKRLKQRRVYGQYKASQTWKKKREERRQKYNNQAKQLLSKINHNKSLAQLACALLYWAEGSKGKEAIRFTNSNPQMINTFMNLLRIGFNTDEKKLKALVHIHQYHDEKKIISYWSKITKIPTNQFYNSYQKPHTGTRKRQHYKGCICIHYQDLNVARQIKAIYNMYAQQF